ncbi:GLPGLI family protein [Flavobacterium sp.]|uniref:GLPGLI family protein n=1 Tax=Flavobacterium sp. TaxID=239 RepID=UPI003BBF7F8C
MKNNLKKSLYFLILFISVAKAQDFHGRAIYVSKQLNNVVFHVEGMSEEKAKELNEKMSKMFEKTFTLNFNKNESLYQQEQKLQESGSKAPNFGSDLDGELYKNIQSKKYLKAEEFANKNYLISDTLINYNWELKQETKKIGDYICYKAISIIKVTKKELEEYEAEKQKQTNNKTSFLNLEKPEDEIITVWYNPEIPVSQGPNKYWGLPGLIMEVNQKNLILLCSKVILNPKDKKIIKAPKKGKIISQSAYDLMEEEQFNKLKDENGAIHLN